MRTALILCITNEEITQMKKAFKLTIVKRSDNGATIEYFLSSFAAKARLERLQEKGFVVTLSEVTSFKQYCEAI